MARAGEDFKGFETLWDKHVALYREIFIQSLERLSEKKCPLDHEDKISLMLPEILLQVCFEKATVLRSEIQTPKNELPIPPLNEEEREKGSFGKRPDFTCIQCDHSATSPEFYELPFHIECKRIGQSANPSWNLNWNYVDRGVRRFDSGEHGYGKRALTGMMIGYVISMTPPQILSEVNSHLGTHFNHHPPLQFTFGSKVVECIQMFQRKVVEPVDFKLIHIWVDLR